MGSYFFETGKIAGGLFGALALALTLAGVSNLIFAHGKLARPGYSIAVPSNGRSAEVPAAAASNARSAAAAEKPASEGGAAVVNESRSAETDAAAVSSARTANVGAPERAAALSERPSSSDEKKAEADSKACQACDAPAKGVAAKAGPPLFAIVDRPKSSIAGLAHSNSLRPEGANWTADDLDQFLASRYGLAGGAQAGGEADAANRADIVEYLRALSDHPRRGRSK